MILKRGGWLFEYFYLDNVTDLVTVVTGRLVTVLGTVTGYMPGTLTNTYKSLRQRAHNSTRTARSTVVIVTGQLVTVLDTVTGYIPGTLTNTYSTTA